MLLNSPKDYVYILGLYLADGCISKFPRTFRLRLFFHSENNEDIIQRSIKSLSRLFPKNKINILKRKDCKCKVVSLYNSALDEIFPQHGIGPKSSRVLKLTKWQKSAITKHTGTFLKGLFDGDGSRYFNNARQLECVQFTNKSKELLEWFTDGLDKFNIKYCLTYPKSKKGVGNILIQNPEDINKFNHLTN